MADHPFDQVLDGILGDPLMVTPVANYDWMKEKTLREVVETVVGSVRQGQLDLLVQAVAHPGAEASTMGMIRAAEAFRVDLTAALQATSDDVD